MDPLAQIIGVLIVDPRGQATALLTLAAKVYGATAGALCDVRSGAPIMWAGGVGPDAYWTLVQLWESRRADLEAGKTLSEPGRYIMAPIYSVNHLVGVLYLDGATEPPADLARFLLVFARTLTAPMPAAVQGGMSDRDTERARLLAALEKHHWTLSRVARELGVTRATVYTRMRKHGIPRGRVALGAKEAGA